MIVRAAYFPLAKNSTNRYMFGFNGMEKDNEVKGLGNSLDFGARIYDSRLGRWLSLDPSQIRYPSFSPYNFVFNSPLIFVDPDGRDPRLAGEEIKINILSGVPTIVYTSNELEKGNKNSKIVRDVDLFKKVDDIQSGLIAIGSRWSGFVEKIIGQISGDLNLTMNNYNQNLENWKNAAVSDNYSFLDFQGLKMVNGKPQISGVTQYFVNDLGKYYGIKGFESEIIDKYQYDLISKTDGTYVPVLREYTHVNLVKNHYLEKNTVKELQAKGLPTTDYIYSVTTTKYDAQGKKTSKSHTYKDATARQNSGTVNNEGKLEGEN